MMSAWMAFTETSWPQSELTVLTLIFAVGTPRDLPTDDTARACSAALTFLVLTTICRVFPEPTSWAAPSDGRFADRNASSVWCVVMVVPAAWIWNWLPPANSTPKLKPRKMKLRTQISRITPDAKYHRLRVPMKLKLVSPRYSLRKTDISPVLARPSSSPA